MVTLGFRRKDDALLPKDNERSDIHNGLLKNVSYEAPSTPATVPTAASPEDSIESNGGRRIDDLVVVSPDDPPGTKMERVKSLENGTQKSNDSGDSLRLTNQPNTYPDPPPSESLVNKVFGMMDISCVSPGFGGGRGPMSSSNLEFRPEWGVAPEDDDEEEESVRENTKSNQTTRSTASSTSSSVSSTPITNASTTSDPTSTKTSSKYYQKRHENFELVYKEKPKEYTHKPNSKERNKGLLKKLKAMHIAPKETPHFYKHRSKKSKKATTREDHMTTQTNTTDSETTATTTTERNRRRRMGTRIETTQITIPEKVDTPESLKTPDSKESSPSHSPRLLSITKNLKKAFSKEGTTSSTTTTATTATTTTTTTAAAAEEEPQKPSSPRGFRRRAPDERRAKRQKPPAFPLETVHEEETEENDETTAAAAAVELKVPVPGGGFISDKDLIGEEVVEEIYNDIEHEIQQERKEKGEALPTALNRETTQNNEASQSIEQQQEDEEKETEKEPKSFVREIETSSSSSPQVIALPMRDPRDTMDLLKAAVTEQLSTKIGRTWSWKERLGFKKHESAEESIIQTSIIKNMNNNHNDTGPMVGLESTGKKKPLWKAVVDQSTGKTYYYHRKTRETTWQKPPDEDIVSFKEEAVTRVESHLNRENKSPKNVGEPRSVGSSASNKNEDIAQVLGSMSPLKGNRMEKLVAEYDGREDELLVKLRSLAEQHPFDEPGIPNMPPDDEKTLDEKSLLHSRTLISIYSGFSGKFSEKSKISEKTELIRNTGKNKVDVTPIREVGSHTTSLSSPSPATTPPRNHAPSKIPNHIPVPRLRELNVEEFTTSDRVYDASRGLRYNRPVRKADDTNSPQNHHPSNHNLENTMGDNDFSDKDTASCAATDSISALSDADLSFLENRGKEPFPDVRRRALDRAIAQEDWDLAAQMSEGMRSGKAKRSIQRQVPNEWIQSEMDRFISESDWDAVSAYIAAIRNKAKEAERRKMDQHLGRWKSRGEKEIASEATRQGRVLSSPSNVSEASSPQKRFGARSQLQHEQIQESTSYGGSSYSSYDSEYTSESYYSDEEPARRGRTRKSARGRRL